MGALVEQAAVAKGFDAEQATMLAACSRNIYAVGCGYHPSIVTSLEEICKGPAADGAGWAVLLLRCLDGQMPRLRSAETAAARLGAARAAAQRRKAPPAQSRPPRE